MNRDDFYSAHCVRGIPPTEILTPFPSIRSLVNSQVRRYGDRTFLIAYGDDGNRVELSYKDFSHKVFQGANYLRERNVTFGDRVVPQSTRGLDALLEIFAIWTVGSVAVLDSRPARGNGNRERFENIIVGFDYEFETGKKSKIDDDVLVVYSRTGDGRPGGIRLTHYNLLVEAMAVARRQEISEDTVVVCGLSPTDITGIAGCVMPTLYEGGTLVIPETPSGALLSRMIEEEHGSVAFVGKSFLDYSLNGPGASGKSIASLNHLTAAAQDLTVELIREVRKDVNRPVVSGLAIPEAASFASLVPISRGNESLVSWLESQDGVPAGTTLEATEITVLDELGNERGEKQRGEIVLRGHTVMKGYLEDDLATAEAFRSGWLHTGEPGFYRVGPDGDRYFFITG